MNRIYFLFLVMSVALLLGVGALQVFETQKQSQRQQLENTDVWSNTLGRTRSPHDILPTLVSVTNLPTNLETLVEIPNDPNVWFDPTHMPALHELDLARGPQTRTTISTRFEHKGTPLVSRQTLLLDATVHSVNRNDETGHDVLEVAMGWNLLENHALFRETVLVEHRPQRLNINILNTTTLTPQIVRQNLHLYVLIPRDNTIQNVLGQLQNGHRVRIFGHVVRPEDTDNAPHLLHPQGTSLLVTGVLVYRN